MKSAFETEVPKDGIEFRPASGFSIQLEDESGDPNGAPTASLSYNSGAGETAQTAKLRSSSAGGRYLRPGDRVDAKVKHRIRAQLDTCLEGIERVLSNSGDAVLRYNSFDQLCGSLETLWSLRHSREEEFAELINMLQNVFFDRRETEFTEQLSNLVL